MKKLSKILAVVLALAMVLSMLTACGSDSGDSSDASGKKLKVALVLPGKKDDVSFNQAMYRGMQEYADAHSDEVDLNVVENVYDVADITPTLTDFADEGYDVIIGHGFQFTEPVNTVAKQYADQCFLLGCGIPDGTENVTVYDVQLEAGGYLMGVVAALATQSNKVGVIGGGEGSEITRGHEGFKAGAKSINPDIEIQEVYTGDWTDTTGAYEAAIGMYDSGVDVIWHSGDGIGLGVVQAGEEKDMYVLGNVESQVELAPKNVLSGIQYEWAHALNEIFASIKDGSFIAKDKATVVISFANEGMSMVELNDVKGWLTDDDLKVIEDTMKGLRDGSIELPEVDA